MFLLFSTFLQPILGHIIGNPIRSATASAAASRSSHLYSIILFALRWLSTQVYHSSFSTFAFAPSETNSLKYQQFQSWRGAKENTSRCSSLILFTTKRLFWLQFNQLHLVHIPETRYYNSFDKAATLSEYRWKLIHRPISSQTASNASQKMHGFLEWLHVRKLLLQDASPTTSFLLDGTGPSCNSKALKW